MCLGGFSRLGKADGFQQMCFYHTGNFGRGRLFKL